MKRTEREREREMRIKREERRKGGRKREGRERILSLVRKVGKFFPL